MILKDIGTIIIKKLFSSGGNKHISIGNGNKINISKSNSQNNQYQTNNYYLISNANTPNKAQLTPDDVVIVGFALLIATFIVWNIITTGVWNWTVPLNTNIANCMSVFTITTLLLFGITIMLYLINIIITFFCDGTLSILGISICVACSIETITIYLYQTTFTQSLMEISNCTIRAILTLLSIALTFIIAAWNLDNIIVHRNRYTTISTGTAMTITYIIHIILCLIVSFSLFSVQ